MAKASEKDKGLKTASVLAFERKLTNSDALMFAVSWDERYSETAIPIIIKGKDVRGTISNRQKTAIQNDPAKLDAEIQKPNLQRVDSAALSVNTDTLKVFFTLRVLGDLSKPSACNNPSYEAALREVIDGYVQEHGFSHLAQRYAHNIANARFLWRNRIGAEAIEVNVKLIENNRAAQEWKFDSLKYPLVRFDPQAIEIEGLSAAIKKGLEGQSFVLLQVAGFARLGRGQEVFPSQELVLDDDSAKSKVLYQVDGAAAVHSQKIGNALRTIDTWYPEAEEFGPIPVEPFGAVTSRGRAYRQPKDRADFYTLLDGWVIDKKIPPAEQQHYVIATLIRGGVFGEKD